MLRKIIKHELANLSVHTELLEACDWDEDALNSVMDYVANFLADLKPPPDATWDEFKTGIEAHLNTVYGKEISCIIINVLVTKAEEIKFYMEQPTND